MYGKSTIFNALTGMNQHTGNWPGKTVENASGIFEINGENLLLVDIPGTYSIMSNSEEEEIARNYICFGNPDATVIILDATCLERNLNLVFQIMEITPNIVVCVNLLDEAKKKGIHIDLKVLQEMLGVPVVGTIARKKKTLENLKQKIYEVASGKINSNPKKIEYIPIIEKSIKMLSEKLKDEYLSRWISLKLIDREEKIIKAIEENLDFNIEGEELKNKIIEVEKVLEENNLSKENIRENIVKSILNKSEEITKSVLKYEKDNYSKRDRKIDKILTSKVFGIPIMIVFLGIILWITIVGANYPSQLLSNLFGYIEEKLVDLFTILNTPLWLKGILIDGIYKTVTWVIAVMLPPMAIFFPMFTLLEDLGYLPRIAFNLDKYFKRACSSRKTGTNYVHGSDKVVDF